MKKKIICLGMVFVMLFSLCACEDEKFALNQVSVIIKEEFREKFENEEFTLEDFQWENLKDFTYESHYDNIPGACGSMTVYLKEPGKEQVLAIVDHLSTLDFVEIAELIYKQYIF